MICTEEHPRETVARPRDPYAPTSLGQALRDLARNRATIIISHRLASLMHADQIIFLDGGAIIERGSHAELLQMGGRYRALYDLQIGAAGDSGNA